MRIHDMIVDERQRMATLLESLTDDQWRRPTLCANWTVHDIAAHLVTFLRFGQAKLYTGLVLTAGNVDRINLYLTRREARRPRHELIERLRNHARSRMSIPRSGYDPVLTDLMLHDLDVRRPLGIPRETPEDRLWVAFNHLTLRPSPGFTMGSRLEGLRLHATDTGWTHGEGALVEGDADALLLAIGGRRQVLDELDGDGVELLRERLADTPPARPAKRMATVVRVVTHPAPPERRSRAAVAPPRR
jgi:uncharacterized protein (TIGR03083 family)